MLSAVLSLCELQIEEVLATQARLESPSELIPYGRFLSGILQLSNSSAGQKEAFSTG